MRRAALLFSVCLTVSVWAGNGNSVYTTLQNSQKDITLKAKISRITVKPFCLQEQRRGDFLKAEIAGTSKQPAKKEVSLSDLPVMKQLKKLAAGSKTERLDSIVCTYSGNGEKISLQTFTYDDKDLSLLRTNSLWNTVTKTWEPVEEYGYEWDKDGYCLRQWGRGFDGNSGVQYAFTYNDKKLGIEQVISNYTEGEWVFSSKGEYIYDENDYIIDETISVYDTGTKSWSPIQRSKASWTKLGQQTSYEVYSREGTNWIPADEKAEYAYDENGNVTLYSFSLWKDGAFVNYYRVRQEFKDNLITLQTNEFWNPIKNDWVGCYDWKGSILYSTKTDLFYDEQGKQTLETAYIIKDLNEGWYKTVDSKFSYTPLDNGGYRQFREMYLYEIAGERVYDEVTKEYNKNGQLTYFTEKQDVERDGNLLSLFEEYYEYAENGDFLKSKSYEYELNKENLRLAAYAEDYRYDNNHNIIDSYYQQGALYNTGEGGAEDWMNVSRFIYTYESDTVRTEKFAYLWDGMEFIPNWGEAVYFDFDVPVENCIMWQDLQSYHKIKETRSYAANDGEWDYQAFIYHYSGVGTGVENNSVKRDATIYLNPVTNILYIHADGDTKAVIYNIQGARLLVTQEKQVNMSSFQPGVYIVDFNGVKTKVIKA